MIKTRYTPDEVAALYEYMTPDERLRFDRLSKIDWRDGPINLLNLPAYGLPWSPYHGMQVDMLSMLNVATAQNPLLPITVKNKPDVKRLPRNHYRRFGLRPGELPFVTFAGGAAGPGKTDCIVLGALAQVYHPDYRAVIFRRLWPALSEGGSIVDRCNEYYPFLGAVYNATSHVWTFPTGAKIYLRQMQYEDSRLKYQSSQYQYVAFDELTEFTERQFTYMFARARTKKETGLRTFVVAASNPGGDGHNWVKKMFITSDITRKIGHFVRRDNEDVRVNRDTKWSRPRIFLPGTIADNPSIAEDYKAQLHQQDEVMRARYLEGDWDADYDFDRVYPNWNSLHNVTVQADYNPQYPVHWTCDDGYRPNPRVILLLQVLPDDTIVIFNELYQTEKLERETIADARSMAYPAPEIIVVDPSATSLIAEMAHDHFTRRSTLAGGNNKIAEGVKMVRREICDYKGVRKIKVHPRCTNLIEEITKYRYDEKLKLPNGDPRPVKQDDHGPDALRYYIATTRQIK